LHLDEFQFANAMSPDERQMRVGDSQAVIEKQPSRLTLPPTNVVILSTQNAIANRSDAPYKRCGACSHPSNTSFEVIQNAKVSQTTEYPAADSGAGQGRGVLVEIEALDLSSSQIAVLGDTPQDGQVSCAQG
jgi:hypothetical protein